MQGRASGRPCAATLAAVAVLAWILAGAISGITAGAARASPVEDRIGARVSALAAGGEATAGEVTLAARDFLAAFYAARDNRPAWSRAGAAEALVQELERGIAQGFRPADFHLPRLLDLHAAARGGDAEAAAVFDIVATDAAVRLVHHILFGKVDASELDPDWNFARPVIGDDPVAVMSPILDGPGLPALMARVTPDAPQYASLVAALARYRAIQAAGGWPQVPEGAVLKPGMADPRVPALRARLAAEGALSARYLSSGAAAGADASAVPEVEPDSDDAPGASVDPAQIYDPALVADLRRFQERHGLEPDGVIGPQTAQALNRTAAERVDQLRLSLERARWLMHDLGDDFVLVNIAAARTYVLRHGDTLWKTRSITGSQYRKTPLFRDAIRYMEINPTWTVPNTIFAEDKLPRIRQDPGYLERNGYEVRNAAGETVPAASVDWWSGTPRVTLVQRPGPDNALGRVKFMFPNAYAVYLHDTNDRSLFDRTERNLSSGCVRLEHPYEFADLLMQGAPDWSRARMEEILASGRTTRVDLPEPIPVLLTYWTAWEEDGAVHFREDIYERDGPLLAALNAAR